MLCRKIDIYEQKKHIFEIENNGYSVIRSYIHEDAAKELELIAKNLFKELKNNSTNHQAPIGFQNIIKHDLIVNNAPCLSKEFLEISTLGDHLKILNHFLNDPYYGLIPKDHSNFILAQSNLRAGKVSLPFHVDVRMVTEGNKSWSYQGFLGLNSVKKENGCLRVIPKSHFLNNIPDSKKNYESSVSLEIERGDLVIFSSQLHHATHEVRDNQYSWSLLLTYRSWWCKQQFDFCKMIDPKIFKHLQPNQKLLLGACSKVPDTIFASPSSRQGYEVLN